MSERNILQTHLKKPLGRISSFKHHLPFPAPTARLPFLFSSSCSSLSRHHALLPKLSKTLFLSHPVTASPLLFHFSYLPPQVINYSTIHRSATSGAPTTTMARVTCIVTCSMRLLLQEARSPLQMSSSRRFPSGRKAKYKCIYI